MVNKKMGERKTTIIRVRVETKKALDEIKIHHRETYDDVISRLLELAKKEERDYLVSRVLKSLKKER